MNVDINAESNGEIRANRKVRDSVFSNLMRQKKYLLQVYKELYPDDTTITEEDLDYITIENIFVNGHIYNDLGVSARNSLVLFFESQSSWTENILIRILFYIVEWLKLSIGKHSRRLYGSKKIKLPRIEAYVVYTGDHSNVPKKLSLTDSFMGGKKCSVDVEAQIITEDESNTILNQYIRFSKIYTQERKTCATAEQAIKNTIEECIKQNILKEYIKQHEMEVEDMMVSLFDEEAMREDEMEEFKAECRAEGRINGAIETMLDDGKSSEEIIKRLIKKFVLTEAEAKEKLSSYSVMA